jgi:hypothetical protein
VTGGITDKAGAGWLAEEYIELVGVLHDAQVLLV